MRDRIDIVSWRRQCSLLNRQHREILLKRRLCLIGIEVRKYLCSHGLLRVDSIRAEERIFPEIEQQALRQRGQPYAVIHTRRVGYDLNPNRRLTRYWRRNSAPGPHSTGPLSPVPGCTKVC
jgi:hypothetical protein